MELSNATVSEFDDFFFRVLLMFRFMEKSTAEWEELFEGTMLPCGPINNVKQVFENPQVRLCCYPWCGRYKGTGGGG